jgi:hypothetical protein
MYNAIESSGGRDSSVGEEMGYLLDGQSSTSGRGKSRFSSS